MICRTLTWSCCERFLIFSSFWTLFQLCFDQVLSQTVWTSDSTPGAKMRQQLFLKSWFLIWWLFVFICGSWSQVIWHFESKQFRRVIESACFCCSVWFGCSSACWNRVRWSLLFSWRFAFFIFVLFWIFFRTYVLNNGWTTCWIWTDACFLILCIYFTDFLFED